MENKERNSVQLILTDTHFGWKTNSLTWLEKQKSFIYNTVIPSIKRLSKSYEVNVLHLGDLFDSRSSISPYILHEVNKMLVSISDIADSLVIIGGNHDYYSPQSDEVSSLYMLPCMYTCDNVKIVVDDSFILEDKAFIPWFSFHDEKYMKNLVKEYPEIHKIFTHTDLDHLEDWQKKLLKGKVVFSGHIHTPKLKYPFYQLGATYPLTFMDANQERGMYIMHSWDPMTIELVPNNESIKFYRVTQEDAMSMDSSMLDKNDYVEVYVSKKEYETVSFKEKAKQWNEDTNCTIIIIPDEVVQEAKEEDAQKSIIDIITDNCPEPLKEKLDKIISES